MGCRFPGTGKSGNPPPRPECAAGWHDRILEAMPTGRLTLLIGQYAQRYYSPSAAKPTVTETGCAFRSHLPRFLPLPHPSPRDRHWLKRNSWFETDLLPELRRHVASALA